jgi:hypothetical protein
MQQGKALLESIHDRVSSAQLLFIFLPDVPASWPQQLLVHAGVESRMNKNTHIARQDAAVALPAWIDWGIARRSVL